MSIEELHSGIVATLEKRADPELASKKVAKAEYFGIHYDSYGVQKSEIEELISSYLNTFRKLLLEERFSLVILFYDSRISEQIHFGDVILELSLGEITPSHFKYLEKIAGCLKSWGETDWYCSRIIQPLLLKYPQETVELLKTLNQSSNMWKKRVSVVAFTRKIGESGKFTDLVLELCDNLMWDKEDLVRKGVGWALKDNMRGSKEKVLEYVKSLRRKGVSSVITLYAIRDIKGEERKSILSIKPDKKSKRGH